MLRALNVLIRVIGFLLYSLPLLMRAKWLDRRGRTVDRDRMIAVLARRFGRALVRWAGVKVSIEGLEHVPADESVLLVSNHQGLFDIPLLMGFVPKPIGFIAKEELRKIPIIGVWMTYLYCVFMDRKNLRQSLQAINLGAEYLKAGHSLVIFPEGTRSRDGRLLEFKAGSFKLATKSGAPILPVTIQGASRIMGYDGFKVRPGEVRIAVSPLVRPQEHPDLDINGLCEHVRQVIANRLG